MNRLITRSEIESVIKNKTKNPKKQKQTNKKTPCKQKSRTGWLHWGILPNLQRRMYTYPQTHPKYWRRGNTPKFILWSHHHPNTQPGRHYRRRKLQANIFDEYRRKNPQQNMSKLNPAIHKKDHTPWSRWIHSGVTRMVQHIQINQCDIPH